MHRISGLILGAICIGLFGSLLVACNGRQKVDENSIQQIPQYIETESPSEDDKKEIELIALAENQQEAEKIAELYGIELSSFSDGVAVYITDKDPQELTELGEINGYPALSVNNSYYQLKEFTSEIDINK